MAKKSPSAVKYDKENPVVSIRLKRHELEIIEHVAGAMGTSKAELVRDALWRQTRSIYSMLRLERQYGRRVGRAEAIEWFPCSICGEKMLMTHGDVLWIAARDLLQNAGWAHGDCRVWKTPTRNQERP